MTGKRDHETSHSLAREVYASNILDSSLPRLDGFERCGESFDTVIQVPTRNRIGQCRGAEGTNRGRRFTKAKLFDRIEFVGGEAA